MDNTPAHQTLVAFRGDVYAALGHRKDSLFELMEAALTAPGRATLVRLSLEPAFRRAWPSAPDALADGRLDADRCRRLARAALAGRPAGGRPVWAADGTPWPRPAAATSPERTYGYRASPGIPQDGVIPAWEYEWLVDVPEPGGSWVRPLDVRRRGPRAGPPSAVIVEAVGAALAGRPPGAPRPVVVLDSTYDPVAFARAGLGADVLVRLRSNRKFFRAPGPYPGRGTRARKHGPLFRLSAPATHGAPDRAAEVEGPTHGRVRVEAWLGLHAQAAADAPFALVRITAERLPRRDRAPAPLWLAWVGGALPEDLAACWPWYGRRFTAEHGFRFLKQDLGWTAVRPKDPAAADRWSWLLALALWQLWLARGLAADRRLPWERPLPPARLTPGRVRRAFPGLLPGVGSPAGPPKPRGKSPGRRPGQRPGPRPRHRVARRDPKRAA